MLSSQMLLCWPKEHVILDKFISVTSDLIITVLAKQETVKQAIACLVPTFTYLFMTFILQFTRTVYNAGQLKNK